MSNLLFKALQGLKQRSVQTLLVLFSYVIVASFLPPLTNQILYSISLTIKDALIWIMPLTVGFFIANAVTSFERRAPFFIVLVLIFEACSNFSSVWYAYGTAHIASGFVSTGEAVALKGNFSALWHLPFTRPSWWSAEKGSIVGLLLGCVTAFNPKIFLKHLIVNGKNTIEWILTKVFARLIPVFVLGFAAQMYQTKVLSHVITHYSLLVLWLVSFLVLYIAFLFMIGAGFSMRRALLDAKNLLPAGGTAVLTGCSLSTMPITIAGTAKNLRTPSLAQALIPATTNIQQVGDCIVQAFLCFLIYRHFYGHNPDLSMWMMFSVIFTLARFATAAVLGGAIFIMLPIYEHYLNFNTDMIAVILTLNVVLDPIVTSSNVITNGALCRIFEKVWESVQGILSSPAFFLSKK